MPPKVLRLPGDPMSGKFFPVAGLGQVQ